MEGNRTQLKCTIREQWRKLTDDEFDQLVGKLQEKYGLAKERAEEEVNNFIRKLH